MNQSLSKRYDDTALILDTVLEPSLGTFPVPAS
jgi:hypothetical protein